MGVVYVTCELCGVCVCVWLVGASMCMCVEFVRYMSLYGCGLCYT